MGGGVGGTESSGALPCNMEWPLSEPVGRGVVVPGGP